MSQSFNRRAVAENMPKIFASRHSGVIFNTENTTLVNIDTIVPISCRNSGANTQRVIKELETEGADPIANKT
jgi:hypothetical protein